MIKLKIERMKYVFLLLVFCHVSCNNKKNEPEQAKNYQFSNGVISRDVLDNYLSRAITQTEFLNSDGFYNDFPLAYEDKDDDTRMLLNVGAKFIGRAIYSWNIPEMFNNTDFWKKAKAKIDEMHAQDADLVFQAAIFELVSTKVNQVPVPDWVFEAYNLPVEHRNFVYTDMLNQQGHLVNQWGDGASVPDITRQETQLFFYFMACVYMETGIEALHFGQVILMSVVDQNNKYAAWRNLLGKVKEAARTKARRGTVLCDGHMPGGGIVIDGHLLFDFLSFPMRPKEIIGEPQKAILEEGYLDTMYGRTKGGITPSGWSCDRALYICELDNFGIGDHPNVADHNSHTIWGYDEVSWFSIQPEEYRNEFIEYVANWISKTDPVGYFQMLGARVTTTTAGKGVYRANTKSASCTAGQSQEKMIKKIWNE
jgi:hypothetical protein